MRSIATRALAFMVVFASLQFGWQSIAGAAATRSFIAVAVVQPAALLVNTLTPAVQAHAVDTRLRAPGGGVNIVNGCDGMELLFLLLAGFAVAPISLRARLLGAAAGLPVVYALNQLRILALFYAHQADAELFDLLHGYVAPVITVLLIAAYFHAWLHYTQRPAVTASA